ncbi:hypothetical protein PG989_001987 [Apiospora arundinis]
MLFPRSLLLSIAALEGCLAAQAVPNGTPLPGNYTGPLRPQVHYSPPTGFMNDPNGMFYLNGVFHLYYQYNPTGLGPGNQHWGHATSKDGYTWENQAIALFPPNQRVFVYSGSAVVDINNTSGFFPHQDNGVVVVFTFANYNEDGSTGPQTQAIAYSHDEGYTFQYYDGNPVINSTSSQFRDPKVIWYGDHWAMVVAYSQEFVVAIYTSPDLKEWTWASNFTDHGLLGAQYECPNIVKMPVRDRDGAVVDEKYVLTISLQPGAPLGGSVTEYFIGDFNGTHFTTVDAATRLTDFAKDNYAAQFFYGVEGNPINMGWASNWQYTGLVPTGNNEGWRSAMTLPRVNYLTKSAPRIGWTMVDDIYDPKPIMSASPLKAATDMGNGNVTVDYSDVESRALYIEANVTGLDVTKTSGLTTLNLTFTSPTSGESLRSGFYFGGDSTFFVDRGQLRGFDNVYFTDKFSIADVYYDNPKAASWSIKAVIDRSMYEVFVGGGRHAGTVLLYPTQPLTVVNVAARDMPAGAQVSVAVWALNSTWAGQADGQGTVLGNVTTATTTKPSGKAAGSKRHMIFEGAFSA